MIDATSLVIIFIIDLSETFNVMNNTNITSFCSQELMAIFNETFSRDFNTRLVCGSDEPLYKPADQHCEYHQIIFAHGYFSSALHEIAHWLVAGEQRRLQLDYGYWYEPDGRDQQQQAEFEKVEILPQAIEWAIAASCGFDFEVSSDNLSGIVINRLAFKRKVYQRALHLLSNGFSARTCRLLKACQEFYQRDALRPEHFEYQGMYQLVE